MNVANFLRTAFSIEHLWYLLLFLLEGEEEESMKKEGTKNFSNEKRKGKHFIQAVRQDITKIVNFFTKLELVSSTGC